MQWEIAIEAVKLKIAIAVIKVAEIEITGTMISCGGGGHLLW